jgi:hypothetical protein
VRKKKLGQKLCVPKERKNESMILQEKKTFASLVLAPS